MSPPDDLDNHAALTGPSYRATGPGHRGTAPANRGTRVAQATPGAEPSVRGTFIGRTLRKGAEQSEARAVAAAQLEAQQLVDELRPFYAARYAKYGGIAKHRPGDAVPITVLGKADFAASLGVLSDELLAEEQALITKYIPITASKEISGFGRGPDVTLIPVTASTALTQQQKNLIRPKTKRSGQSPGAFYSVARDVIVIRVDQVAVGAVAHELCHAYASRLWNEFYVALSLQRTQVDARGRGKESLAAVFFDVDEGVTSTLAQDVVDDWYAAPMKAGMHARPAAVPSALVGYMRVVLTTAENFISAIDGTLGTPKGNTFRVYFGGDIAFSIDETAPLDSRVRCGSAKPKRLQDLL